MLVKTRLGYRGLVALAFETEISKIILKQSVGWFLCPPRVKDSIIPKDSHFTKHTSH